MTKQYADTLNLNSLESRTGIKFNRIYFPSRTPVTRSKGLKGRSDRSPFFVNQARGNGSRLSWVSLFSPQKIHYKLPLFFYTSVWLKYQRSTVAVFKSALGILTVIPGRAVSSIFSFFLSPSVGYVKNVDFLTTFSPLLFVKTGTKIGFLSDVFKPYFFFAKSFGSSAKVLGFDRWSGFLTVRLPSNTVRLFFFLSRCFRLSSGSCFNPVPYESGSRSFWKKAGTHNILGIKPRVRGVAKNPVDHPHGGRAKSIKFQQTPWGKATKKK